MIRTRYRHIFLFTGQGAQYPGMAGVLYRTEPVFRQWMDELDRIPEQKTSITRYLYGGGGGPSDLPPDFDDILVSHPALFMVQFALAKTMIHYGIIPHCLVGTSLGEFVALALAGVMEPGTMLKILIAHARALRDTCPPGAMVGVADSPERYDRDPDIFSNASLAGIGSPRHFVVSGSLEGMKKVIRRLGETDTKFQLLPVRFGFHSPAIDPVMPRWREILKKEVPVGAQPKVPVISCCTGRFVVEPSWDSLTEIGRLPIRFPRALNTLDRETRGPFGADPLNILDLGPGAWSSGFVRQNKVLTSPLRIFRVMTLFGSEVKNMEKIKGELIPS